MKKEILSFVDQFNLKQRSLVASERLLMDWKREAPDSYVEVFDSLQYPEDRSSLYIKAIAYQIEVDRDDMIRYKFIIGMKDHPNYICVYFLENGELDDAFYSS